MVSPLRGADLRGLDADIRGKALTSALFVHDLGVHKRIDGLVAHDIDNVYHRYIICHMKSHRWSEEKNALLKEVRSIGFEQVVTAIEQGCLLDTVIHPNTARYSHQQMYVVQIGKYVYLVPFVETEEEIFLKTIISSRKYTKRYLVTAITK